MVLLPNNPGRDRRIAYGNYIRRSRLVNNQSNPQNRSVQLQPNIGIQSNQSNIDIQSNHTSTMSQTLSTLLSRLRRPAHTSTSSTKLKSSRHQRRTHANDTNAIPYDRNTHAHTLAPFAPSPARACILSLEVQL